MSISFISQKQLRDRIQAGEQVHLIDVRTPAEFREVHATEARNTPLESLDCGAVLAAHPTNAPLYVICRSGSRGKQACEKFTAAGCKNVVNVEGGTMALVRQRSNYSAARSLITNRIVPPSAISA